MTILTDVDQVLLDWASPFQAWAEARGWPRLTHIREVYHPSLAFGISVEEANEAIRAFNDSSALDDQPAFEGALDVVPILKQAGYHFVAITACGASTARMRPRRLAAAFGFDWGDIDVVELGQTKTEILKRYHERLGPCFWIEDSATHAVDGAEIGHRTFLIDHPYNRTLDHPKVTRVDSWHDILRIIAPHLAPIAD